MARGGSMRQGLPETNLVQIVLPASVPTSRSCGWTSAPIFSCPSFLPCKFFAPFGWRRTARTHVAPASFTHSVITREGKLVHSVITGAAWPARESQPGGLLHTVGTVGLLHTIGANGAGAARESWAHHLQLGAARESWAHRIHLGANFSCRLTTHRRAVCSSQGVRDGRAGAILVARPCRTSRGQPWHHRQGSRAAAR